MVRMLPKKPVPQSPFGVGRVPPHQKRGTEPFGVGVYRVVSRIPRGQTLTYREVVRQAGRPRAYRSVGSILSKNTDPKRIPCHRVVRSDGKLGGYRWGMARKRAFLKKEGAI